MGRGADGADLFSSVTPVVVPSELLERLLDWKGGERKLYFSLPWHGNGEKWTSEPPSCPSPA